MEDLYLLFPDEMEKLLERLDGGELSEAEVSRELDKLIAEREEKERSTIARNRRPENQPKCSQIETPTAQDTTTLFNMDKSTEKQPEPKKLEERPPQEITKDRIMDLVEEGIWTSEQGEIEFKKLEDKDNKGKNNNIYMDEIGESDKNATKDHNAETSEKSAPKSTPSETRHDSSHDKHNINEHGIEEETLTDPRQTAPNGQDHTPLGKDRQDNNHYKHDQWNDQVKHDYDDDNVDDNDNNTHDKEGEVSPDKNDNGKDDNKKEIIPDRNVDVRVLLTASPRSPLIWRNMGNDMSKDTNDDTAFYSDKNENAKDKNEKENIPDRNVEWGVPSNVPYQLDHDDDKHNNDNVNTDQTHKDFHESSDLTIKPVGKASKAPLNLQWSIVPLAILGVCTLTPREIAPSCL